MSGFKEDLLFLEPLRLNTHLLLQLVSSRNCLRILGYQKVTLLMNTSETLEKYDYFQATSKISFGSFCKICNIMAVSLYPHNNFVQNLSSTVTLNKIKARSAELTNWY